MHVAAADQRGVWTMSARALAVVVVVVVEGLAMCMLVVWCVRGCC